MGLDGYSEMVLDRIVGRLDYYAKKAHVVDWAGITDRLTSRTECSWAM
jgi:hypothetical protein